MAAGWLAAGDGAAEETCTARVDSSRRTESQRSARPAPGRPRRSRFPRAPGQRSRAPAAARQSSSGLPLSRVGYRCWYVSSRGRGSQFWSDLRHVVRARVGLGGTERWGGRFVVSRARVIELVLSSYCARLQKRKSTDCARKSTDCAPAASMCMW